MSKSFDDFVKQQQAQQKPKTFGYRNANAGGQQYNFNNTFVPGQFQQQQYQGYQPYPGQQFQGQPYQGYNQNRYYNKHSQSNQSSSIASPIDSLPTSGRSTPNQMPQQRL